MNCPYGNEEILFWDFSFLLQSMIKSLDDNQQFWEAVAIPAILVTVHQMVGEVEVFGYCSIK